MKTVEIEATNQCNTRCLHCPHETITRPSGMMTWDTFQVVADKILAHGVTESIDFAGMGEPTLNKNLYRFINYFAGKINTYITTNAATLTSRNIERLIEAELTTIIVSFNGTEPALYESMMGGLSFQRAESYLNDLIRRAEGRMNVVANVSVTRQTQNKLSEIKQYLHDTGVQDISFSKCHSRGGHLNSPIICNTPMPPVDTGRCDIYANTLFVSWTGEVLACCHDLDGVAPVGNLVTQPLTEILAEKQTVLQNGVRYDMCGGCNDLYRFVQDPLPNGQSISDWVYVLYQDPAAPGQQMKQLIAEQKTQINNTETELKQLETTIAKYEQGRVVQLLQNLGIQPAYHPYQANGTKGEEHPIKGDTITLMDWMGSVYQQENQDIGTYNLQLKEQEQQLATLATKVETARMTLRQYQSHPFIRMMKWMKTRPALASFF